MSKRPCFLFKKRTELRKVFAKTPSGTSNILFPILRFPDPQPFQSSKKQKASAQKGDEDTGLQSKTNQGEKQTDSRR